MSVLLSLSLVANAAQLKLTGIFSNLKFGTEDLVGAEIFLVYSNDGYFASVQCAEGSPSSPVLVSIAVSGATIEFTIPTDAKSHCPKTKYRGTISEKGLRGKFEGTDYPGFLMRKKSYWQ